MPRLKISHEERFWRTVDKNGPSPAHRPELGPCWLWTKSKFKDGYGQFAMNRWNYRAHRVAWEFANGPLPEGKWVLHKCDTPACCNPAHLYLGDVLQNARDRVTHGRQEFGDEHWTRRMPHLVPRGVRHGRSRLRKLLQKEA